MPAEENRPPSLEEIDARLAEIRARRAPKPKPGRGAANWKGAELAWRMVVDLAAGIAVGLTLGWGLDSLLGTKPVFIVVFVLLGFAAGVRIMLRSAEAAQARGREARDEAKGADAPKDEGR